MVDTLIRLFRSTDTSFTTNGIGILTDVTSCIVKEERNGGFELEMSYPINGRYYNEITLRRIIVTKPNPYSKAQPFRIYRIDKTIKGTITVNAQHIGYDLSGYPIEPFTALNKKDTFSKLKNNSIVSHPFTFWFESDSDAPFSISTPMSTRSILGGEESSILDVYGGEYEFDNYTVRLWNNRGSNNGVVIRYGKNLTDLQQEENCASVYTGVYPYWYSETEEENILIQLSEKRYIEAEGKYDFVRLYPLDLSDKFDEPPTEEQLKSEAVLFMKENQIGIPKVSLKISFIELTKVPEYRHLSLLEQVRLCDIVKVEFPQMQVSATAKCISTTYNVLTNRYDDITLGDTSIDLATTIVENGRDIGRIGQNSTNLQINQSITNKNITKLSGTTEQKIASLAEAIQKINESIPYRIRFEDKVMNIEDEDRSLIIEE